jgi:hypothetical protein
MMLLYAMGNAEGDIGKRLDFDSNLRDPIYSLSFWGFSWENH